MIVIKINFAVVFVAWSGGCWVGSCVNMDMDIVVQLSCTYFFVFFLGIYLDSLRIMCCDEIAIGVQL